MTLEKQSQMGIEVSSSTEGQSQEKGTEVKEKEEVKPIPKSPEEKQKVMEADGLDYYSPSGSGCGLSVITGLWSLS